MSNGVSVIELSEPPDEVKRNIIAAEIQNWLNTSYQFALRYRVQKRIGGDPELLKSLEADIAKVEQGIDVLKGELRALDVQKVDHG